MTTLTPDMVSTDPAQARRDVDELLSPQQAEWYMFMHEQMTGTALTGVSLPHHVQGSLTADRQFPFIE